MIVLPQSAREEAESPWSWLHNWAACSIDPAAASAAVAVRVLEAVADGHVDIDASSRAEECVVLREMFV